MANPEHLKIIKQGVEAWNQWRKKNTNEPIDLRGADLSGADLCDAILDGADLNNANLSRANLSSSNLSYVQLNYANFSHANFCRANLFGATIFDANLFGAALDGTSLFCAVLDGTNLSSTVLDGANFSDTTLIKTDFNRAQLLRTIFGNVDLSEAVGLDNVNHAGPSTIGIDTIYKSQGKIPDRFLRDAGVRAEIIDIARSIRNGPPIQWHSCFISYSTKDEEFARRLHARMREANMRVWFAPEDLGGGKKLYDQIVDAIPRYDKLLVVLSENSIKSEWVMTEIRKARETEKKEKRRKLFPIRLCDFETLRDWTCFDTDTGKDLAVEVREYFIPDFSNWKVLADGHPAAFESAFARLKKDLEAENQKPK